MMMLQFISERMLECEPWKSGPEADFDNATEAMEKLVMNRLYELQVSFQFQFIYVARSNDIPLAPSLH